MAVSRPKPFRPLKITGASDRNSSPETSSNPSGNISDNLVQRAALSSLKDVIAAGNHSLDSILGTITDVAQQLTGASGAAIAMWKEGAMVCRARTGDTAPALGAWLSAKTGISGRCLRTGKIQNCADTENDPLVDLEVCRSLRLRSIAVLPIRAWRGINGIIEVFSTKPAAFRKQHIEFLQQLAALAEKARASQPESAWSEAPRSDAANSEEKAQAPEFHAASPRSRRRPFVLGALLGLVAISLLALVIWLGWRRPERAYGKAPAAPSSNNSPSASPANSSMASSGDATSVAAVGRPPDGDAVWKANPGGELLSPFSLSRSSGKPSAGLPVKSAAKVDVILGKKSRADRSQDLSQSSSDVAASIVISHRVPVLETAPNARTPEDSPANLPSDATALSEPPSIPAGPGQSPLNGVLSAKASLPGLGLPVSQGVTGGQLVHRVPPTYPAQARAQHLEGTVILAAVIMEDGTIRDVRVIEGEPLLAQSAMDAVKNWRYKPYELDGKPVKNLIRIKIDFKFPESNR